MAKNDEAWLGLSPNPLSEDLPLTSTYLWPLGVTTCYVAVCFGVPFYLGSIKDTLLEYKPTLERWLHNFTSWRIYAQLLNCIMLMYYSYKADYSFFCQVPPRIVKPEINYDQKMVWALWAYYMLKITDLFDAILILHSRFTVNRLQMYHHASLVFVVWLALKYQPGGSTLYPIVANMMSGVCFWFYHQAHKGLPAGVYSIYRALYTFQAIQFTFIVLYELMLLCQPGCAYPAIASIFVIVYTVSFPIILYSFYNTNLFHLLFGLTKDTSPKRDDSE